MKRVCLTIAGLALLLGVMSPVSVFARNVRVGVKGGLSIPNLQGGGTEISSGYKSRLGPDFGLFSDVEFTPHFSVELGFSFVGQGGVKNGLQPIPSGSLSGSGLPIPPELALYADFKNEAILNYLEIPILGKYSMDVGDLFGVYLDAGPNFGILVSAKTNTSGTSNLYINNARTPLTVQGNPVPPVDFGDEKSIRSDVRTLNFGLTGGLGIFHKLGPGEISLDWRGSYGLTNIQTDTSEGNNRTGCLVFTVGYSIPL